MLTQFYKWVDVGIPDLASADKLGQTDYIQDDFNLPLSVSVGQDDLRASAPPQLQSVWPIRPPSPQYTSRA